MTKGQYSPTTPYGSITKSSPDGTIENPFRPGELVIGAEGNFFARVIDKEPRGMEKVMIDAANHKGTSIIEVLQNCVIFNDHIHESIVGKDVRDDRIIMLEHGKPMIFGKDKNKGIRLCNDKNHLEVITIGENGYTIDDVLVHDSHQVDRGVQMMLAQMKGPDYPVAVGVIRDISKPCYSELMDEQIAKAKETSKFKCVDDLLHSGNTWTV